MSTTLTLNGSFTTTTCCHAGCGIMFAIPTEIDNELIRTHQNFYCPRGHSQHYVIESEEQKLRREAAQKQARIDCLETDLRRSREYADANLRSANTYRGHVTKIKRRVAHGVCPCCKRTFQNLAEHMNGQHPDFVEAAK